MHVLISMQWKLGTIGQRMASNESSQAASPPARFGSRSEVAGPSFAKMRLPLKPGPGVLEVDVREAGRILGANRSQWEPQASSSVLGFGVGRFPSRIVSCPSFF